MSLFFFILSTNLCLLNKELRILIFKYTIECYVWIAVLFAVFQFVFLSFSVEQLQLYFCSFGSLLAMFSMNYCFHYFLQGLFFQPINRIGYNRLWEIGLFLLQQWQMVLLDKQYFTCDLLELEAHCFRLFWPSASLCKSQLLF